jgi:hypothetical protein
LLFFQLLEVHGCHYGAGMINAEGFTPTGETFAHELNGALAITGSEQEKRQVAHRCQRLRVFTAQ